MAKKPSVSSTTRSASPKPASVAKSPAVSSTPVRNTPVPNVAKSVAPAAKRAVTYEMIAFRAFELYQHGRPGSDMDHWLAAESELRGK